MLFVATSWRVGDDDDDDVDVDVDVARRDAKLCRYVIDSDHKLTDEKNSL